jgi:hypothetical protein|tara:strand:+ start:637 stop:888 length:252 start_codon:yes stop_codon:yes gene_type:complete
MTEKKHVDPIPEEFDTLEEAAEFWDTHDTMDYPDAFRDEEIEYEIEIEKDLVKILKTQARQKGVSVNSLANTVLRQHLTSSNL